MDPRRTPVAALSDIHLAIRPGSNLALVNALMHVILFEEKAQDDAFIDGRTEHFDALRALPEGRGGGVVIRQHPGCVRAVYAQSAEELEDADTVERLEALKRFL